MAEWTEQERAARRAKREARRAKQRELNPLRADKMHAARLAGLGGRSEPDAELPVLNVGCSGWFYWHWRHGFYPAALPTRDWFDHYASRFRTVELNAPFYAWPTVGTVETWRRQVGRRRFVYSVKAPELITHIKRFRGVGGLVEDFGYVADLLGPRMGCFLFQFPPSFHFTPSRLKSIVTQLQRGRRNVVEFRHRSWWNDDVYAALREHGVIFCSCSGPRLPDELIATSDEIYLRFHGTERWYRHDYSREELTVWVDRVRASKARRVWAYFNNDREQNAIRNARLFLRMLKAAGVS